ncbi:hypothetical protein PQX77_005996 [Marasmius sp. AFHP31]|nr:hypothetical protein PQX77_005996 [Marasmius sp. AFHP31]
MQSNFFPDAHDFSVFDSNFTHVQGDQHNNNTLRISRIRTGAAATDTSSHAGITQGTTVTTIHGNQFNQVIQQQKKEPTEFDDFRIVKRGDICRNRDVVQFSSKHWTWHRQDCQCESCQQRTFTKTVCIGKVEGTCGTFTVMSYSGPGGRKAFERDFRQYSSVVSSKVPQMYAVDIGSVPSILYWNELVPAVVLKGNLGWMGSMYLFALYVKWGCKQEELWMDPTQGVICCGPSGPHPNLPLTWLEIEDMPSTVDLLQEDVCLRFMASCKSEEVDRAFVEGIRSAEGDVVVPESFDQPTVISALTQTPIAVANNFWEGSGCFKERTVLEGGLTRFRVVGDGWFWLWLNNNGKVAWVCQALGVFHARGIGLDDDLSVYGLVWHVACLQGDLSRDQIHCQQQSQQPIYLFLQPPPPNQPHGNTSSLHFWSFHEDGQNPFPPNICNNLGLPTMLEYTDWGYESYSWSTKYYRQLDEYQRLRGFDPTTTDFARHTGCAQNIFNPVNDNDRFNEVHTEPSVESRKPPPILDYPDKSGVDNDTEYPAFQQRGHIENLDTTLFDSKDKPTLAHVANKRWRIGEGEEKILRVHAEQNLYHKSHSASNEQSVSDPSLRTIHPIPRRSLSLEELYSLQNDLAHLAKCASNVDLSSLQHYGYVNPHEDYPLPGLPASLSPTSTSFSSLPTNMNTTSGAAFHTEITPRVYPEIPQYAMATSSSRDELSQPVLEWSTYGATNNAFPSSASTITSIIVTHPGNSSTHTSQTTGWPGVSPLDISTSRYHRTSASALPNDVSISTYTPPIGYTAQPGIHAHGPYSAIPQGYPSFPLYHGDGSSFPEQHWDTPATQLEPRPVSSGPYADPSVYEQPTSSSEAPHAPHTTGCSEVPPLETSTNNYHLTSPSLLPSDSSIPSYTPPTDLGVHTHGPYPNISLTPYNGDGSLLPEQHWNVPVPQLEPQPSFSGPYAGSSLYGQPTSSSGIWEGNQRGDDRGGYQGWQ